MLAGSYEYEIDDPALVQTIMSMRDIPIIIAPDTDLPPKVDLLSDGRFGFDDDGENRTNTLFPFIVKKKGDFYRFYDTYSVDTAYNIALLQEKGIMTAWNGEFEPSEMLTRAEAVTILYRMYLDMKEIGNLYFFSSK